MSDVRNLPLAQLLELGARPIVLSPPEHGSFEVVENTPTQVEVVDPKNDHPPLIPPGMSEFQMKALDGGTNYSGVITKLFPGQRKRLLNAQKRDAEGMIGIGTVHVAVSELERIDNGEAAGANQRLILWVSWGSGKAGDDSVIVDCTKGAVIAIPGTISITIDAELLTTDPDHGVALGVEATVHWGTSVSPRPVLSVENSISFDATAVPLDSAMVAIPTRAQRMTLLSDDNQMAANATIEFFRDRTLSSILYTYRAPSPTRKIDIVSGARFFRIHYLGPLAVSFIPDFELAL